MLTLITAVLAVAVIAGTLYIYYRSDQLDELEDELSKYEVHLDERANKLSAEEETVRMLNIKLREELEKQKMKPEQERTNEEIVEDTKKLIAQRASDRYELVRMAAEEATGWKLSNSRTAENSTMRAFISYHMHNEGFSYESIGRVMHRNHSTITHLVRKMEDMLSLPGVYQAELEAYEKMCSLL